MYGDLTNDTDLVIIGFNLEPQLLLELSILLCSFHLPTTMGRIICKRLPLPPYTRQQVISPTASATRISSWTENRQAWSCSCWRQPHTNEHTTSPTMLASHARGENALFWKSRKRLWRLKYCNKQFTAYEVKIFIRYKPTIGSKSCAEKNVQVYSENVLLACTSVKMQELQVFHIMGAIFYG
ncbi:hypothetical protein NQ317_001987 [Molorchus minor]|uniref:Uncharacterized protein n=1 Tax=Molorchus minor TaxID=1323400 RepID=A0ABQ9JGQ1_9CUCU|nr:hypothetical protein NQ317_001987 [Molorchus minor]